MKILFTILILFSSFVFAQEEEPEIEVKPRFKTEINTGAEINPIPYFYKGFHGTLWLAYNEFRFKATSSKFSPYEFVRNNSFSDLEIWSLSLSADYFPNGNKRWIDKIFYSIGFGYWHNEAVNEDGGSGEFKEWIMSGGIGYVKYLYDSRYYISPQLNGYLRIGGDKKVNIVGKNYNTQFFTPEIIIAIGVHF